MYIGKLAGEIDRIRQNMPELYIEFPSHDIQELKTGDAVPHYHDFKPMAVSALFGVFLVLN